MVLAAAALATLFAWAPPASARAQPLDVSYAAPAGCSSRNGFLLELARRTRAFRLVEATPGAELLIVEVADRAARVSGTLRLVAPSGAETVRAVSGASCDEVVSALALIAAVLIDPDAPARMARRAPPLPPQVPPVTARSGWRLRPSLGAGAALSTAVAPRTALGPRLELGLEVERGGLRGPAITLALEHLGSVTQSTAAGNADFGTTLGRLALCPLRWPRSGPLVLAPCGGFELGALHAAGSETHDRRSHTLTWLAADALATVAYQPLSVLRLGLALGAVVPFEHNRFIFGPATPVFRVPAVGFAAQAGVQALWP